MDRVPRKSIPLLPSSISFIHHPHIRSSTLTYPVDVSERHAVEVGVAGQVRVRAVDEADATRDLVVEGITSVEREGEGGQDGSSIVCWWLLW